MKSTTFRISVVLMAAALSAAAADTSPESALQVISTGLQVYRAAPKTAQIPIVIKNVSSRTITAYSYSLRVRYADGRERTTARTVELLQPLMLERLRSLFGSALQAPASEPFASGRSIDITEYVPLSRDNQLPVSAATTIRMVALEGNGALGDLADIRKLRRERQLYTQWLAASVADLRKVQRSSSPRKAIDDLISVLSGKNSGSDAAGRVSMLRVASRAMDKRGLPALEGALKVYEAQLSFLMENSIATKADK